MKTKLVLSVLLAATLLVLFGCKKEPVQTPPTTYTLQADRTEVGINEIVNFTVVTNTGEDVTDQFQMCSDTNCYGSYAISWSAPGTYTVHATMRADETVTCENTITVTVSGSIYTLSADKDEIYVLDTVTFTVTEITDGEEQEGEGEEGEGAGQAPPEDDGDEEQFEFDDDWMPPENFNKIVEAVRMGKNVALYGPAGCGKTDIATHVGMALELQYYITTAPQMPYDLTGFVDATGTYTETAFSVPFMRGGIAVLDELDRSSPEAVIAVNAPIANGTMFVPKVGQFTKHKDCIFMATLNTVGLGADDEYVTANQLDASTRDRFIWFPVNYDERVELKVARGDKALVSFAQDWREACAKVGVTNALFSYRVIKDFKDLCENRRFGVMEAIETTLLKGGVPKSTCLMIQKCFQRNNKYHKAFKMYVEQMEED